VIHLGHIDYVKGTDKEHRSHCWAICSHEGLHFNSSACLPAHLRWIERLKVTAKETVRKTLRDMLN